MVARVLFPDSHLGGRRSHPHPRATIKAINAAPFPAPPPSPLRIARPPAWLPNWGWCVWGPI